MTSNGSKLQQFLFNCVAPVICSIALGSLIYGSNVFNRTQGAFQFLWSPIVASVFYYLLVFVRSRDADLGLIILLFLTLVTTRSTHTAFILRDIFYVGATGGSMLIYFRYFKQGANLSAGYTACTVAGIYGLVFIVCSEIHLLILRAFGLEHTGGNAISLASATAFFGLLIGFAVGAGITIAGMLFGDPDKLQETTDSAAPSAGDQSGGE